MTVGRGVRSWVVGLVIAHVLLGLAFSLSVPLGEAPDEADHWAYVQFLARERRLPRGPELTQAKHPPLFHATAALWTWAVVPQVGRLDSRLFLRANPDVSFSPAQVATGGYGYNSFIHTRYEEWPWRPGPLAFHWARFWSLVLSALTVVGTAGLARTLFPEDRVLPWVATGVVAFLPEFAFIGSVLNNDVAAACAGVWMLWGGARVARSGRWTAGWWTPLVMALGFWAKVSTSALWPAVLLAWCAPFVRRGRFRRAGKVCGGMLGVALLLVAPWWIRNWRLYGDPLGWALVRQTVDVRRGPWTWQDTVWLLKGWFLSFWGKFGSAGHIPMARGVYLFLLGATLVALVGLGRAFYRGRAREVIFGLGLAVLGTAGAIWRYSLVALGTDQGRLLFPALGAIALLLALGWLVWVPRSWRGRAGWGMVGGMFLLSVYALLGVLRPAYAPPPPSRSPQVERPAVFGPLVLRYWRLHPRPELFWTLREPTDEDLRVALRFVDEGGHVVWEWKRSPGAGRWSTDHWPLGYVMRDVYPRARWAHVSPGRYRVEVGVYPFMGAWIPPDASSSPFFPLGWIEVRRVTSHE